MVSLRDHDAPYHGPMQMFDGPPVDGEPAQRFAGEADWIAAGDTIPEAYLAWIEAEEAAGRPTPAVPLTPAVPAQAA